MSSTQKKKIQKCICLRNVSQSNIFFEALPISNKMSHTKMLFHNRRSHINCSNIYNMFQRLKDVTKQSVSLACTVPIKYPISKEMAKI